MSQAKISLPEVLEHNPKVHSAWTSLQNTFDADGNYSANFKKQLCDELYLAVLEQHHFAQEDRREIYEIVQEFVTKLVKYHLEAKVLFKLNQSVTNVQSNSGGDNGLLIFGIVMLFFFLIPGIIIIIVALSDSNKQSANVPKQFEALGNTFQTHYADFMSLANDLYNDYGYSDKQLALQCQSYFNRLNDILATYTLPRMYVC